MIEPDRLQQIDRTYVRFRRRKLSYFAGCDYFRLASHPQVIRALLAGLKRYGLTVSASRLTTGNHPLYGQLEKRLARFFGAEAALLVPTGYVTNLAVAQALAGRFSHALMDTESHPSLVDAAELLNCPVLRFKHRSPEDLAQAVERCGPRSKFILLTDGMFSRDGSVAPLKEYSRILPRDAVMLVDDAHAAGVLGSWGHGTLEQARLSGGHYIQTISLSKALGCYGGAILSSASLRRKIMERSRLFVGSTPLPLPLANAALRSLELLQTDKTMRQRLIQNALQVNTALRVIGLPVPQTPGPIIALRPRSGPSAAKLRKKLLQTGIYPPLIRYPGGPAQGYFRFVISSEHTSGQMENLVEALSDADVLAG